MRVTAGPLTRRRHKRLLKLTKGYRLRFKNLFKRAFIKTMNARRHAFRCRRIKKREYRSIWIVRINAAIRQIDPKFNYSKFINGLKKAGIEMNRKMMAELAYRDMGAFGKLLEAAKSKLKAA